MWKLIEIQIIHWQRTKIFSFSFNWHLESFYSVDVFLAPSPPFLHSLFWLVKVEIYKVWRGHVFYKEKHECTNKKSHVKKKRWDSLLSWFIKFGGKKTKSDFSHIGISVYIYLILFKTKLFQDWKWIKENK